MKTVNDIKEKKHTNRDTLKNKRKDITPFETAFTNLVPLFNQFSKYRRNVSK